MKKTVLYLVFLFFYGSNIWALAPINGVKDNYVQMFDRAIDNSRQYVYPSGDFEVSVKNSNNNYIKAHNGDVISLGMFMMYRLLYPDKKDYPNIVIAPYSENWLGEDGTNMMQLYFAIAVNYHFHKRKTTLVCRKDQKERIMNYLKLGNPYYIPKGYLSDDILERFRKEAIYLADRGNIDGVIQMIFPEEDMVDFVEFKDDKANVNGINMLDQNDGSFLIEEENRIVTLDSNHIQELDVDFNQIKPIKEKPKFGVTFLGASSGMDSNGLTSNHIVWAGDFSILVDAGPATLDELFALGLSPADLSHLILTHMHEDHIVGALRYLYWCKQNRHPICLIMEPGIYSLFKQQSNEILGMDFDNFFEVDEYIPLKFYSDSVQLDQDTLIECMPGFHGTPVVMTRITYKDHTVSHSSDTTFDPLRFNEILNRDIPGYIKKDLLKLTKFKEEETLFDIGRIEELESFLFKPNIKGKSPSIVIYEAGNKSPLTKNMSNHTTAYTLREYFEKEQVLKPHCLFLNHTDSLPKDIDLAQQLFVQAKPMCTFVIDETGEVNRAS